MKQKENDKSEESEWIAAVHKAPMRPVVLRRTFPTAELPKKAKAVFSPSPRQSGDPSPLER